MDRVCQSEIEGIVDSIIAAAVAEVKASLVPVSSQSDNIEKDKIYPCPFCGVSLNRHGAFNREYRHKDTGIPYPVVGHYDLNGEFEPR